MDTLQALKERCSIRQYTDQPVAREMILEILDCARMAPTARNLQPWEFIVVRTAECRQKIAAMTDFGQFIADAPVCLLIFCAESKYFLEDGAAATTNCLLAAHALGLGACWIAGDKKDYARPIAELLGVPAAYHLVALIALGYPVTLPVRKEKRPLAEQVHWEVFSGKDGVA